MPQFTPIINRNALSDGLIKPVKIGDFSLLLIVADGKAHLIENKCGHFGVPLDTGEVKNNTIVCAQHGIAFDLETGENANRPWEDCEKVTIYTLVERGDELGIEI